MEDEERPTDNANAGDEGDASSEMRKIMNYPLVKVYNLLLFSWTISFNSYKSTNYPSCSYLSTPLLHQILYLIILRYIFHIF